MKNIQRAWWAALLLPVALWLLSNTLWPQPFAFFPFREAAIQLTGIVAIAAMSAAMVLAARPRWLEQRLNGLDKMYRLHKWLGITALVGSVAHWLMTKSAKWMVGWGWIDRPVRGPRPVIADPLEAWVRSQRHMAEGVGEWAFYGAVVLIAIALITRIPYHWFARTHRLISVAYLALVVHTLVLLKFSDWTQPVGWLTAAMLLAGAVSALLALSGWVRSHGAVKGQVVSTRRFEPLRVLRSTIALSDKWPGHAPGQFAYVTEPGGQPHPFTIASAWDARERTITFVTKALGDDTARSYERLEPGTAVKVQGPYGRFTFDDGAPRQIWIGGGIGITPFLARMEQLAAEREQPHEGIQPPVTLFHTTREEDPQALALLAADARAAGVNLHVLVDARDGRLDGQRIRAAVAGWREASIWFCGPAAFGQALRADFVAQGLPAERFHQELFEMR